MLGKPEEPAVAPPTFHGGLASMLMIDAIRHSAVTGGALVQAE